MLFACQWKEVANREAIMQGKHAKVLSPTQERAMVRYLGTTPSPARDWVMCLLSIKAGLRPKTSRPFNSMECEPAGGGTGPLHSNPLDSSRLL